MDWINLSYLPTAGRDGRRAGRGSSQNARNCSNSRCVQRRGRDRRAVEGKIVLAPTYSACYDSICFISICFAGFRHGVTSGRKMRFSSWKARIFGITSGRITRLSYLKYRAFGSCLEIDECIFQTQIEILAGQDVSAFGNRDFQTGSSV